MTNNIEQLQVEVDNITNSLKELKDNVALPELEKNNKAEELKSKAEDTRHKIENEIKALESKTDDDSKKKKEEAETLLNSFNETMVLYASILNTWATNVPATTVQPEDEKKWFFWKAKDWVWEQWNDVWNKDKWQEERWKNTLRTLWFIGTWVWAVWLIYVWCKKLFGKEARAERKERRRARREARKEAKARRKEEIAQLPFWQRPFWRFLKWTAIWAAVVWWVYGIFKFLWLGWKKDNPDGRSSDEEKLNWYEEEIVNKPENKEKLENYETFWENIDLLYWSIYERELEAWYEDELEMQKISKEQSNGEKYFKWVVPYCLDNQFKNVDNILWQNSSIKEAMANWLQWMLYYIKSKWNDFLQLFVDTYLDKLPSWLPFKNVAWSLSDKIDQWKVKNQNAEKEMQYFFRQSIRIQTYLFEKKDQLIQKIVKESSARYGISEKDILWDNENFKKYVLDTQEYQNFINSPISSAVTILKNYNIFDCEISEWKKEDVKELDKQRNKVLWCKDGEKDILQIINEKKEKWEDLTEEETNALEKACAGILKDIDDIILEAVEESALSIYRDLFRWTKLWDILGDDEVALKEYLNKSWLEKVFREYTQTITQKKLELQWWKLSNEDKIALAESINAMLALKKEAVLWSQTIEKDYDENWKIIYRIPWFLVWSINNLCKSVGKLRHGEFLSGLDYMVSAWLWTWLVITSVWVIYGVKTGKRWVAKLWAKITVLPAWIIYETGDFTINMVKPLRNRIDKIHYPFKFWWEKWPKKLMDLLKDWKISLDRASNIVHWKTLDVILSKSTERRRKDFFGITDNNENVMYKVFDKLVTETSNTAAWATYLQSIKADNKLYETLVKNYDQSQEIRRAISENVPFDELKRVAEQSEIPEIIRNNNHYKRLSSDLDLLEDQTKRGRDLSELSNAERKQLDRIDDFKKTLATMNEKEIERTAELLWEFKRWKTIWDAISQFDTLRKLEGQIVEFATLDSSGNPIRKSLDDIIKNMDAWELRLCKWKILWVNSDAIESLAKTFEAVRANSILKFTDNIDEIAKAIKILKMLTKAT